MVKWLLVKSSRERVRRNVAGGRHVAGGRFVSDGGSSCSTTPVGAAFPEPFGRSGGAGCAGGIGCGEGCGCIVVTMGKSGGAWSGERGASRGEGVLDGWRRVLCRRMGQVSRW